MSSNYGARVRRNPGNGYLYKCSRAILVAVMYCKTWIGTFGILANSADHDQTPRSAASDHGLHCLFKLQEDKG